MNFESNWVIALLILFAIIILIIMLRSKHFFRCIILSALSGIACLFAVNILSGLTDFTLAVNPVTLGISGIFGVPGVIFLLISRINLI